LSHLPNPHLVLEMRLLALASILSVAALVSAQNVTVIQVGATGTSTEPVLQFTPSTITAANGTVVTFNFSGTPGNHSVTQSSFNDPCQPLAGGFDSGWIFINGSGAATTPTWNLTITNDQKPIWFYCKQIKPPAHCLSGMVGAINAPTAATANNFGKFQSAAKSASGTPGQPTVGALVGVGASASAAPGPIGSGVSALDPPAASATAPSGSGTSGGSSTGTSSSASSTSTGGNGALSLSANSGFAILAAALGIALA